MFFDHLQNFLSKKELRGLGFVKFICQQHGISAGLWPWFPSCAEGCIEFIEMDFGEAGLVPAGLDKLDLLRSVAYDKVDFVPSGVFSVVKL